MLQVNKKLLYQESDLLDVGLVVQKARKQGRVLLQWGFDRILQQTALLSNVGRLLVNCRIQSNPTVTVLYLVSLLFAPPILHPPNYVLDREVFFIY